MLSTLEHNRPKEKRKVESEIERENDRLQEMLLSFKAIAVDKRKWIKINIIILLFPHTQRLLLMHFIFKFLNKNILFYYFANIRFALKDK